MPKISAIGKDARATPPLSLQRGRGFSLIEVMVALAIVVLVAGAMPLVLNRALPTRRVAAAADHLVTDIRWLQIQSSAAGRPARLALGGSGYLLSVDGLERSKDVALARSTSVRLLSGSDGVALTEFRVYPDGTSSAGTFQVSDSGRHAAVRVSMLTGRALRVP